MLNLRPSQSFENYFPQHGFEKSLCDHHLLVAGKLKKRLKEYCNNAIKVRISLGKYGSKIWKVSSCRPTVSNETIVATMQGFFVTEVSLVQSITDIVLLSF